jgi:hypothetical protein
MGIFIRSLVRGVIGTSLALVAACSQTIEPKEKTVATETPGVREEIAAARICSEEIDATRSSVAGFFDKQVRNIEGPVSYCLYLDDTGDDLTGKLRVEYEDDFGIRFYETLEDGIFYAKMETVDLTAAAPGTGGPLMIEGAATEETRVEIIFIDDYGLIQLKGKALGTETSQESMNAKIKYYNFPTFEEALNQAVEEARLNCQSGEWTLLQCLGFEFSSAYWWNEPLPLSPAERLVQEAQAIFEDNTKSKTLGGIEFDLVDVLEQ